MRKSTVRVWPVLMWTTHGYDPAGNLTQVRDSPAAGSADTQCFTYDYLRRLTEAWTPGAERAPGPRNQRWAGAAR